MLYEHVQLLVPTGGVMFESKLATVFFSLSSEEEEAIVLNSLLSVCLRVKICALVIRLLSVRPAS